MRKLVKKYLEMHQAWNNRDINEKALRQAEMKALEVFSKADWEELLYYTYNPLAKCKYKIRIHKTFPEENKSVLVKKYLDLQDKWSAALVGRGDMAEYRRLGKKGDAVRDKFTTLDWAYVLIHTHNVHAKIYYHKRLIATCSK